jgi:hypothetical protein
MAPVVPGLVALIVLVSTAFAEVTSLPDDTLGQAEPLTDDQWHGLRQRVGLLDKIAYLPSLLPLVMQNRDALELTPDQVEAFREWRRTDYQRMVDLMNEIIQRRLALSRASLDVAVPKERILDEQAEIFALQRSLIELRLACRELIVSTFSATQWENLAFILEDYPRYAGLLQD